MVVVVALGWPVQFCELKIDFWAIFGFPFPEERELRMGSIS